MPQRRSGIKALRINKNRHARNLKIKTELKKILKDFQALITQKKTEEAKAALKVVFKKLDKAAKNNLLHKNTANRRKARFSRLLTTIV